VSSLPKAQTLNEAGRPTRTRDENRMLSITGGRPASAATVIVCIAIRSPPLPSVTLTRTS
jgi:hypothetical protein